jgi:hypothetical protein
MAVRKMDDVRKSDVYTSATGFVIYLRAIDAINVEMAHFRYASCILQLHRWLRGPGWACGRDGEPRQQ